MTQTGPSYESSLLLTLGEITQLVVHSHDAAQTLGNIVRLIHGRYHTAVCSVYVLEPERGARRRAIDGGRRDESAVVGLSPNLFEKALDKG